MPLLLYYITDRRQFSGNEDAQRRSLLAKIVEAARSGVDYVQLREKDLCVRDLEALAREAVQAIRRSSPPAHRQPATALLINSRADVAIAAGADGVHLRSEDISPADVRRVWCNHSPARPLVGVSCHSEGEVAAADGHGADFVVFAPVFEKRDAPGTTPAGLARLREACTHKIPVLALGGVTLDNAFSCLEAGAAGIAGIRLFQENDIHQVIQRLRPQK